MAGKRVRIAPEMESDSSCDGFELPDPIPMGEIMTDLYKKEWIIGKSIGIGGFGEVYSAAPYSRIPPQHYRFVIKIEPYDNGPLFVEKHFYLQHGKSADIEAWKRKNHLQHLGMPKFLGSGYHRSQGKDYRFLVMERYGPDLWKLFLESGEKFPDRTVYEISLQIIDVLKYIHSKGYIHADIKGANIVTDLKSPDKVYLIDFGLVTRYTTKSRYEPDYTTAHDGTLDFTSRDAHMGVPTMRGDFEILGYNMIEWFGGSLPWSSKSHDPVTVQNKKEKAFKNLGAFLKQCFGRWVPSPMSEYMKLLAELKFNETPNYAEFRNILVQALENLGSGVDGKLGFSESTRTTGRTPGRTPVRSPSRSPWRSLSRSPPSTCSEVCSSLDPSTSAIVVNSERESVQSLREIVDDMDDDSDEEYNVCIAKKRKTNVHRGRAMPRDRSATRIGRKFMRTPEFRTTFKSQSRSKRTRSWQKSSIDLWTPIPQGRKKYNDDDAVLFSFYWDD